jgi:hypothetical protein
MRIDRRDVFDVHVYIETGRHTVVFIYVLDPNISSVFFFFYFNFLNS